MKEDYEVLVLEELAKTKTLFGESAKEYLNNAELRKKFLDECVCQFKDKQLLFKEYFGVKAYVAFQNYRLNNNL